VVVVVVLAVVLVEMEVVLAVVLVEVEVVPVVVLEVVLVEVEEVLAVVLAVVVVVEVFLLEVTIKGNNILNLEGLLVLTIRIIHSLEPGFRSCREDTNNWMLITKTTHNSLNTTSVSIVPSVTPTESNLKPLTNSSRL
jgi:hypothetical protein